MSDESLHELHSWAADHGVDRRRFHRGRWPHYDMPKSGRGPFKQREDCGWQVRWTTGRGLIEAMRNGRILDELIAEDRAIRGITHPGDLWPAAIQCPRRRS